jgi:hypothetical protein
MDEPKISSLNSNDSMQLWLALVFAILQFFVLEGIAIVRLIRSNAPMPRPDLLHHVVAEMFAPLMICVLGMYAYRKIRQAVATASGDPTILRAVALYGAIVLGFAFLTMDLLL